MSSTKQDKREGVQPLDADDVILAGSSSDEELTCATQPKRRAKHECERREVVLGRKHDLLATLQK